MSQAKLPCFRASSDGFATREQFERWRVGVGGSFDVTPTTDAEAPLVTGFAFEGRWWRSGPVLLGEQTFDAHHAVRTERHVRADQIDHYRMVVRVEGEMRSDADGIRQVIRPGEIVFNDMSRPESLTHEKGKNLVLVLPRDLLDEALPRPVDLHGFSPRGATAQLMADHLRSLASIAASLDVQTAAHLHQATVNLIAACLAPSMDSVNQVSRAVESTLLRQLCRYVDLHLNESALGVDDLIACFKLSRATLYRLFEPLGGVHSYIKERRLARVHALLASPDNTRSIAQLAEDHGFNSATHFSRAFREQYGFSARELKTGAHPAAAVHAGPAEAGSSLVSWMRSLRD